MEALYISQLSEPNDSLKPKYSMVVRLNICISHTNWKLKEEANAVVKQFVNRNVLE